MFDSCETKWNFVWERALIAVKVSTFVIYYEEIRKS